MSRGQFGSYAESDSGRSSRRSTWQERRQKRREDREYEEQGQFKLGEGLFQMYRTMFGASRCNHFNRRDEELEQRDEELERLRRLVRDLELQARGRRQIRDYEDRGERSTSVEGHREAGSHQSRSYRHRDRSREYANQDSISTEERRPRNVVTDAMSCALRGAARSRFSRDIERAPMPSKFTRPPFNSYDGKTNPVKHVSHYIQMMSLDTHNNALMCKVFPSSLGPTALRWFNGLRKGSIHSFSELIKEFGVQFMTCS